MNKNHSCLICSGPTGSYMPSSLPSSSRDIATLYLDHHSWLLAWLRRRLSNACDAADLTQDTFVRILGARRWLRSETPRAYLTTVAKGVLVNWYRRQALEQAYLEALALLPEPQSPSPEQRALVLETLQEIDAMLDTLAPVVRHLPAVAAGGYEIRRHCPAAGGVADQRQTLYGPGVPPMPATGGVNRFMAGDAMDARILDEAADWLVLWHDQGMTEAECADFERWRARSPAHRQAWARAELLMGRLGDLPRDWAMPVLDRPVRHARPSRRQVVAKLAALLAVAPTAWLGWQWAGSRAGRPMCAPPRASSAA
jgi:RNA polymerase sigma factor (sigma-70 family)